MATMNQIYNLINSVANESLGSAAITVKDTGSLVSLGDVVLSSNTNKEQFYKTLVDRIGETVIAIRNYEPKKRSVMRREMEWGCVLQKISYKMHDAVSNGSWEFESQVDPFDVEPQTEVVQKLFSEMATWSFEDSLPDYQLFTAFTDPTRMQAFIAGIYTNIDNAMAIAEENTANLAVDTCIAGVLIKGKATQKRNLLAEYNTVHPNTALTAATCLTNSDFLKFASREIKTVIGNMKMMNTIYNAEDFPRFTPDDKLVVEILGQYASATASYLESDTYHNEMVALPGYEEVTYWQSPGTSFAFADVSKINIQNAKLKVSGNNNGAVEQSGIIAFVHDYDAVASIIYRMRDNSIYNPRAERLNIFKKADKGYAVDLSEQAVVFYVADAA